MGLICQLGTCNALSRDMAILMLRYSLDFNWYDLRIGRGLNFRLNDETSIWSITIKVTLLEPLLRQKDPVFDSQPQLAVFDLHNAILHSQILSASYEE